MFEKILIANRGEIACRVIKTAHKLGIRTVAVYSDADRDALHVSMATEAVHIGGSPARESYLQADRIIQAALQTGAQAIHPGYGFLSENADFCRQCDEHNLVFIGPPVSAIEQMGSKSAAKTIMAEAGVPLVPGYHGDDQNPELLRKAAEDMGYPVLLKAVAGGGGKGMRQVASAEQFDDALQAAKREAKSSFNNDDMLVEKYLTQPRHVEVQVFCDEHGNGVYLFERDCSVQRRHQKIIEEAPAPNMPEGLREEMGETAVRAAQAIAYVGAGTVEFLLDVDGSFFFMEMNTRLQVEHPVTELITGQDLVEWQLRVAAGETLPASQDQLSMRGHAFEARIYAEDPNNDFLPVTGQLHYLKAPDENQHVRVDTGVVQGDEVSVFYDPMIAKLITWGEDRDEALARLTRALADYRISGVTTNIGFLYNLASSPAFINAELDTGFIEKNHAQIFHDRSTDIHADIPLICLYLLLSREQQNQQKDDQPHSSSPWNSVNGWRLNAPKLHVLDIVVKGNEYQASIEELGAGDTHRYKIGFEQQTVLATGQLVGDQLYADVNGHRQTVTVVAHRQQQATSYSMFTRHEALEFFQATPDYGDASNAGGSSLASQLKAPMNGTLIEVRVQAGDQVEKGDTLAVMEAMKMEHAIKAPCAGTVTELFFAVGDLVAGGVELLAFEAAIEAE